MSTGVSALSDTQCDGVIWPATASGGPDGILCGGRVGGRPIGGIPGGIAPGKAPPQGYPGGSVGGVACPRSPGAPASKRGQTPAQVRKW